VTPTGIYVVPADPAAWGLQMYRILKNFSWFFWTWFTSSDTRQYYDI